MLLVTENYQIIGFFKRPVTTSVVLVQLGINGSLDFDHPEALSNLQQAQIVRLERIKIEDTNVLMIREPIPENLFESEEFVKWNI